MLIYRVEMPEGTGPYVGRSAAASAVNSGGNYFNEARHPNPCYDDIHEIGGRVFGFLTMAAMVHWFGPVLEGLADEGFQLSVYVVADPLTVRKGKRQCAFWKDRARLHSRLCLTDCLALGFHYPEKDNPHGYPIPRPVGSGLAHVEWTVRSYSDRDYHAAPAPFIGEILGTRQYRETTNALTRSYRLVRDGCCVQGSAFTRGIRDYVVPDRLDGPLVTADDHEVVTCVHDIVIPPKPGPVLSFLWPKAGPGKVWRFPK